MKTTFKFLTLALITITFYCCDSSKKINFKFAKSPSILACDFDNSTLYKEAIYSFEDDIVNAYDSINKTASRAYPGFINAAMRGTIKIEDIASPHSLKIAQNLKNETNLWSISNNKASLNYSHPLVDCMVNNIKTNSVKQTMNALLATNSMRPKIILAPIATTARSLQGDGSLKAYVAFDFFYSKLLNTKLEDLKTQE